MECQWDAKDGGRSRGRDKDQTKAIRKRRQYTTYFSPTFTEWRSSRSSMPYTSRRGSASSSSPPSPSSCPTRRPSVQRHPEYGAPRSSITTTAVASTNEEDIVTVERSTCSARLAKNVLPLFPVTATACRPRKLLSCGGCGGGQGRLWRI